MSVAALTPLVHEKAMRVLLVEDEMLLRAQVDKYLRDAGFVVDMASNGEKGLYFGLEFDYDVAVIDLGLPKMDGIDLIAELRKTGPRLSHPHSYCPPRLAGQGDGARGRR